jgi:hypothetical protein
VSKPIGHIDTTPAIDPDRAVIVGGRFTTGREHDRACEALTNALTSFSRKWRGARQRSAA